MLTDCFKELRLCQTPVGILALLAALWCLYYHTVCKYSVSEIDVVMIFMRLIARYAVFSLSHVGPTSLQCRYFLDVGMV